MNTRSPGPTPALDFPPSEGNIAALNIWLSKQAAGHVALNAQSMVNVLGASTLGNTSGDTGLYSGSVVLAASNNLTLSQSSGSNRINTVIISGPDLFSGGVSSLGNTAGTTSMVSRQIVFVGSQNVSLSESASGGSATISIIGPAGYSAGFSTQGNTAGSSGYATNRLNLVGTDGVTLSGSTVGGSMTVSVVGKTDWASSNHSHGNPTLALTNITGTTASASNGLTLSLSGNAAQTVQTQNFVAIVGNGANGTGTFTSGTLSLAAGNNVTLSTGANIVSIHVAAPGAGGGIVAAAGTQTGTSGTILFETSAGNGVTFGMSGSTRITAAVKTDYALSDHSHGNPTLALTNLTGTTASNSAGFTLSLSGNSTQSVQTQNMIAIIGSGANGNGTFSSGTLSIKTGNSAIALSTGANVISIFGNTDVAALSHSHGNPTLNLTNILGSTASASNGLTLSLSVPVSTVMNIGSANNSGGTNVEAFAFHDHIHGGVGALAAGSNTGNTSGDTASKFGTWVIAASNNLTVRGSTGAAGVHTAWISAAAAGAGGAQTISSWPMFEDPGVFNTAILYTGSSAATGGSTQFTGSIRLYSIPFPWQLELNDLVMNVSAQATSAGTGSATVAVMLGLYSLNANTALSLHKSYVYGHFMSQNAIGARTHRQWWGTDSNANSTQANGNISASYTDLRGVLLNGSVETWSAQPGGWYAGVMVTQRSSSVNVFGLASMMHATGSQTTWGSMMGANTFRPGGHAGLVSTTSNTNVLFPGMLMPGSIDTTAITNTGGSTQLLDPYFFAYRRST